MGRLIVLTGPTAVGKTDLSIAIAKALKCDIISCDSRQIYKELHIGVAAPSSEQLAEVQHHFIASHSVSDYYSAGQYEIDALRIIESQIEKNGVAFMTGGSMLYIDAICKGIDDIPNISAQVRDSVNQWYDAEGIEGIRRRLHILDPEHYKEVDLRNTQRLKHALEVCIQAGVPYSTLRTGKEKRRSFTINKVVLSRDRAKLYERIDARVDQMIAQGLIEEAESLVDKRNLNALNTVGYKELFDFFDNKVSLDKAVELIKRNTRRYAKKQISWMQRYDDAVRFEANDFNKIMDYIVALNDY